MHRTGECPPAQQAVSLRTLGQKVGQGVGDLLEDVAVLFLAEARGNADGRDEELLLALRPALGEHLLLHREAAELGTAAEQRADLRREVGIGSPPGPVAVRLKRRSARSL